MEMVFGTTCVDEGSMPPPKKILRRGSSELEDALNNGEISLSLPQRELTSWMYESAVSPGPSTNASKQSNYAPHQQRAAPENLTDGRTYSAGETTDDAEKDYSIVAHDRFDNTEPPTTCSSEQETKCGKARLSSPEQRSHASYRVTSTKFSDIIGHGAVKLRLDEVLLPLALPPALANSILIGVRSLSASILLFGPPGCGKTQLAKAIAGEAQAAFLSVGPSDVLSKFVGESEAAVRSFFDKAYDLARLMESRTTVLFFDEIDALGQARGADATSPSGQGGGADPSSRRVLAEILIQLNRINDDSSNGNTKDGFDFIDPPEDIDESRETECAGALLSDDETVSENASLEGEPGLRERIIVVAATNRPEDCDPALVRRFSVRVVVGLPSQRDRKKILKRYLTGIEHTISKEQLDEIAVATDGWSGSDLESLTREAAMAPVRECIRSAALLKKRIRHREQRGGDSSSQNDHLNETNPHEEQREKLLAQFRNLRTVSFEDFEEAILFWTGNHYTCGSNSSSSDQKNSAKRLNHYDSSSDEED